MTWLKLLDPPSPRVGALDGGGAASLAAGCLCPKPPIHLLPGGDGGERGNWARVGFGGVNGMESEVGGRDCGGAATNSAGEVGLFRCRGGDKYGALCSRRLVGEERGVILFKFIELDWSSPAFSSPDRP